MSFPVVGRPAAAAHALSKVYGSGAAAVTALDRVDITFEAGRFHAIMGPSGSGKSTLLHCLAGLDRPSSGSVWIGDTEITRLDDRRLTRLRRDRIGFVFQRYHLLPTLTAEQNLTLPLTLAGRRVDTEWLAQVVAVVGIGDRLRHRPSELSGGQQQRVALARAIVFRPPVLLMDEPLGALDKRLREQLQIEIKRLHRELGITFVFVTHDQEEALAMSDRIALLRDGRIVQVGTPDELYERPTELYTAQFLGESNIFYGTVQTGVFHDRDCGHTLPLPGAVDGPVALVIRPEKIRVSQSADELPVGYQPLSGTVQESSYLGSERRLDIALGDGRRVVARVRNDGPDSRVTPGTPVVVSWHPDDVLVMSTGSAEDRSPQPIA